MAKNLNQISSKLKKNVLYVDFVSLAICSFSVFFISVMSSNFSEVIHSGVVMLTTGSPHAPWDGCPLVLAVAGPRAHITVPFGDVTVPSATSGPLPYICMPGKMAAIQTRSNCQWT